MYSSTFLASTSSGTLPPSTTVSLNALTSNFGAERRLRLLALPVDLAVTDLVAARLSRPRAIAIDLAGDFLAGSIRSRRRRTARPARASSAWRGGRCRRPAGRRGRRSTADSRAARRGSLVVGAELVGELLGVERPPFRVGVEGEHLPNQRHARACTRPARCGRGSPRGRSGRRGCTCCADRSS